ncbi:MAG: ribosomal protein S18-alanine N-acetyltransferase [Polaromonas sp.]|uniref:ribosomal protein S18-alanine N-acetyltransferase n=1 Tax=Polaromonas sp. TaxID=1869339 RepID=UPI0027250BE8|nr:ribosomal protein S18-alanine N-acetyltransferase [Polaromonas sp.]MDO9113796.1 ribosomal protein S18-alanine N-acetyltransferase [Polaromonas sp.]
MNAVLQPRLTRRSMTVRDLDAVVAVETRCYSHPWSRGNFTDSLAAGYLAEVLEGGEGELVGYFIAMTGVDELHLLNITVAPAWQGQGHGQALMAVLQQHAQHQGLAMLWLEVRESNQGARALYRRLGFEEVGLRRGYYPAAVRREDAVVMRLALSEARTPRQADALD